jgi:hypothetical protein
VIERDEPQRDLSDGRSMFVLGLTFARARLVVGRGSEVYDDAW